MKILEVFLIAVLATGCTSLRGTETRTAPPTGPIQVSTTQPNVIPSGTMISILTNEPISAREPGKTYMAALAQDIVDGNGKVLAPKASPAELVIVETNSGGAVGTRSMELAVRSLTVNGRKLTVTTAEEEVRGNEGIGANRRTAEIVGGGAILGSVIGAVVGGVEGAVAGGVIGAGGGAAAQVLTRGEEVRVPAETVLTFRLDQPLQLRG
jgi:hypothetical protein